MKTVTVEEQFAQRSKELQKVSVEERRVALEGFAKKSLGKAELLHLAWAFQAETVPLLTELTEDGEVWAWAVWDDEEAFKAIPERLLRRKTFVLDLVRGQASTYRLLPLESQCDKDVFLTCAEYWEKSGVKIQEFEFVFPDEVAGNKEFVLGAIPLYPQITYYATGALREDFDFSLKALNLSEQSAKGILIHLLASQYEDPEEFFPEQVDQLTDAEAAAQIRVLAEAQALSRALPLAQSGPKKPALKL